jgi:hypothetical protein
VLCAIMVKLAEAEAAWLFACVSDRAVFAAVARIVATVRFPYAASVGHAE